MRNQRTFGLWMLASALLMALGVASAIPPAQITIQGQVQAAGGGPLTGSRQARVRFFGQEAGGAQLGGNILTTASLSPNGRFSLTITPPQAIFQSGEVWYDLAIDSSPQPGVVDNQDQFPGRVRVTSVPFARQSADANALGGLPATDYAAQSALDALDGSAITTGTVAAARIDPAIARTADQRLLFDAIVDDNGPADYTKIEDAIRAGKHSIFVRNGTYGIWSDVEIPQAPFALIGESRDGVVIDLGDRAAICYYGDDALWTTGTLSVASDSKIVTAATGAPAWVANAHVGEFVNIAGTLHEIKTVDSNAQLTLKVPHYGPDRVGAAYSIAKYGTGFTFSHLTFRYVSSKGAIQIRFGRRIRVEDCADIPDFSGTVRPYGPILKAYNCHDVLLTDCFSQQSRLIESQACSRVTISRNHLESAFGYGLAPIDLSGGTGDLIDHWCGFSITENQFSGGLVNYLIAVRGDAALLDSHGTISGNVISGYKSNNAAAPKKAAIYLLNADGVGLSNNVVRDCDATALLFDGSNNTDIAITGNIFTDNTGYGVRSWNNPGLTRAVLTNNILDGNAQGAVSANVVWGTMNVPSYEVAVP